MAEPADLIDFKILSGRQLVSKDINGKSDPYYVVGLCDDSGRFTGPAPLKSDYINSTLEPVWLHSTMKRRATLSATLPMGQATGIRIEIWDYDRIGSDEFMGEAVVFFKNFHSDSKTQYWTLPLEPRKSKPKEKITGHIVASYKYITKAWELKARQDEEDARRQRIKQAEAGIEQQEQADFVFRQARASELRLQMEREMLAEKQRMSSSFLAPPLAASSSLITSVEMDAKRLSMSIHQPPLDISLDAIDRASRIFIASTGGGQNPVIRSKAQLREVLTQLGVFDEVSRYVFWSGGHSAGIDSAVADEASKIGAKMDPLVIATQNDQVWEMFDLDKDSSINFEELVIGLAIHSNADPRSRAEFYFGIFDRKGKGFLDREEVTHLLQMQWRCAIGAMRGGLVGTLLHHPDLAAIDPAEIRKIGDEIESRIRELDVPSSLTDVVFARADTDKSGSISKQEYITFIGDQSAQEGLQEAIRASLLTAQLNTKRIVQEKLVLLFQQLTMKM